MWTLTNALINNLGYIVLIAFTISKSKTFQKSLEHKIYTPKDIFILSSIFSCLGILGTYFGVNYYESIVNIRNIGIIVASIMCGPLIGGISGLIASIHRIFIGMGPATALPCAITTLVAGVMPGYICKKNNYSNKHIIGAGSAIIVESLSMILIGIITPNGSEIIKVIYIPMAIINVLGVVMVIGIIDNILKEKEKIAGRQAKLALEIANETLPYFKDLNGQSLKKVCEIIRTRLHGEAVIITDKKHVLAYDSRDENFKIGNKKICDHTEKVIETGEAMFISDELVCKPYKFINGLKTRSGIIAPLEYDKEIIGVLKIYFTKDSDVTERKKYLILGLSNLISIQIQLGNIKNLKEMANKAEIHALQAQINPHFLFNALNTITSFVRINPNKARELIINLANYLRYNIEFKEELVELQDEINQVESYVYIEKCRFGDKINVHYHIDEAAKYIKVPPLIIQPLVENSIKHGLLNGVYGKNVWIMANKLNNGFRVTIEDDGCGIENKIINKIYNNEIDENKIGLHNVYSRVKLIYGKGLKIERLEQGTRISFTIKQKVG